MKKTILCATLLALMGTQVHADLTQPVTPAATPGAMAPSMSPPPTEALPSIQPAPPATATAVINCDYKIPPQTKVIDQSLILSWSQQAVIQAFSFSPDTLDVQMQKLQACFTDQGWSGFSSALQKSGNLDSIKSQKLNVSSQMDGTAFVTEATDSQWKVTVPLTVTYQNDKEKVNQLLSVNLVVTRKPTGDLGITQMIATPRGSVTTQNPVQPTAAATPPVVEKPE
jgi:Type-IV b secretion system, inner-membrane complex component